MEEGLEKEKEEDVEEDRKLLRRVDGQLLVSKHKGRMLRIEADSLLLRLWPAF